MVWKKTGKLMQNFPQDNDATVTLEKYNAHFSLNYEKQNKKHSSKEPENTPPPTHYNWPWLLLLHAWWWCYWGSWTADTEPWLSSGGPICLWTWGSALVGPQHRNHQRMPCCSDTWNRGQWPQTGSDEASRQSVRQRKGWGDASGLEKTTSILVWPVLVFFLKFHSD